MRLYSHRLERVFLAAIPNRLLSSGARLNIGEGIKTFLLTTSKVHNPNCLLEDDAVLTAERLRVYGPVFIWVESLATVMFMTHRFDRFISGLLIHI